MQTKKLRSSESGKTTSKEGVGEGGATAHESERRGFRKEAALSLATVLDFIWNHMSRALLCRAIPGLTWVEGVPSTTNPLLRPFSIYEDSKQGRQLKNLRGPGS